jgi:hypothetical protein
MATYQGVEASEIVNSIKNAQDFVKQLGCGGLIKQEIEGITASDLQNIASAQTEEQCAAAMRNVKGKFTFMAELFMTHAYLDTNGQAADVVRDLDRWSALSGARMLALTALDQEINDHLAQYPKPTEGQAEAFHATLDEPYMRSYGIEFDLSDRPAADDLARKVQKALEPFWAYNEVDRVGLGLIGDWRDWNDDKKRLQGIMFSTSPRGMDAVHKALPQYDIIDSKGATVKQAQQQTRKLRRGLIPKPK